MNEQQLVKQAKQGKQEALSTLYDQITPKLFGFLVNTLKDKHLAEDVLQTTWLKAINALSKFDENRSGLSPWLFAIAKNECRQVWRKQKHEGEWDEAMSENIAADVKPADDVLNVEKILEKLNADDAEILRLRYIADLSVKDIAKALNINSINARVKLHRAVKRAQGFVLASS